MAEFFDSRLEIYDDHMRTNIDSAEEFYRFTAEQLPKTPGCRVLDLGCGTGLELEYYFPLNPAAKVTGIDLAPGMLGRLKEKFTKDVDPFWGRISTFSGEEVRRGGVGESSTTLWRRRRRRCMKCCAVRSGPAGTLS